MRTTSLRAAVAAMALALVSVQAPAAKNDSEGRWVEAGVTASGHKAYYWSKSRAIRGGTTQAIWQLVVFTKPVDGARSRLINMEFNCYQGKYEVTEGALFASDDGTGIPLRRISPSHEFFTPAPGSVDESVMEKLCEGRQ